MTMARPNESDEQERPGRLEAKGARKMDSTTKKAQETFTQNAGKAVETLSVWADANQRVLRELAELSAVTAKESVRLYGEIAQSMVQALSDAQAQSLRWQAAWQDAPKDPMLWYHRALSETVDNAQKAFRLLEGNAQAVTKSAERLSTTAEQAGKGIQETFTSVVTKMKEVYAA
jgi:methyl-accepting chemotaxis protein